MLQSLDGKRCDYLPHQDQYDKRLCVLRRGLAEKMLQLIDEYCEENREVATGRLFKMGGFSVCYQEAVESLGEDGGEANQLIGQMLWEVLRHRPETWTFMRPERDGSLIPPAMHYWIIE